MEEGCKKAIVTLNQVEKSFGQTRVVKGLDLEVGEGEFLTLLGPSGCGKTTTLRMIAGFEQADGGRITLEGVDVAKLPPNARNVNTVFQNYALFPHMNVADNVAFGLVEKRMKKPEIKKRVAEMLRLVQLEGMEKRMPAALSGGQKQRVAIARALVNEPGVLLLDEPLGALDLKLRRQMQIELKHLQKRLGITFVYVTHDQEEALTMSDRIAVMNGGVLEQVGTPEEIYNHPKTRFVADFIGESNLMAGRVEETAEGGLQLVMDCGTVCLENEKCRLGERHDVCIRPEKLKLSAQPVEGISIPATVQEHVFIGAQIRTIVQTKDGKNYKISSLPDEARLPVGSRGFLYWRSGSAVLLPGEGAEQTSLELEAEDVGVLAGKAGEPLG